MEQAPPTLPASPVESGLGDSSELLEPLLHLLVHMGHAPEKLVQQTQVICSRLKPPAHAWDPAFFNFVTVLGDVIARWYTEKEFVESTGNPAPLTLQALRSLIARVLPNEDPDAVVEALLTLQGIRREGDCYVPTDRQLRYTEQEGWVYGLRALRGFMRTVDYNITRAGTDTIQERVAVCLHFPAAALTAFHLWLKEQGREFLWQVYCRMKRHELPEASGPTTRLSVALFAFEDPMITGTSRGGEAENPEIATDRAADEPGEANKP